ncbi:MAG: hypothetical protein M3321_08715 [Actinomycetota bacterium]|nr:hypothetical protein [Actinomycetota bacterium]
MIQVGFAQSEELSIDDCGARGTLTHYWEYRVSIDGAPAHCAWLDGTPVHRGQSKLYTVFRKVQTPEVPNNTTWEARIEGVKKLAVNLRFDGADALIASGELVRSSPPFGPVKGGVDACYGCSGSAVYPTTIQWQKTSAAGSTQWTDIPEGTANYLNTDGEWIIGDIPTWAIRHPYTEY